jgi:hypothetical protein
MDERDGDVDSALMNEIDEDIDRETAMSAATAMGMGREEVDFLLKLVKRIMVEELFTACDVNDDGAVSKIEFLEFLREHKPKSVCDVLAHRGSAVVLPPPALFFVCGCSKFTMR